METKQNYNINIFFDGIYNLTHKIKNVINNINLYAKADPDYFKHINLEQLPNISIALNHSIVDVGNYYKKHNLCFYDFSPLSYIILYDLCNYTKSGVDNLVSFFDATNIVTSQGAIGRICKKKYSSSKQDFKLKDIKNFFQKKKIEKEHQKKDEIRLSIELCKKLNIFFNNYSNLCEKLYNYKLEENIASAIINFFKSHPDDFNRKTFYNIQSELIKLNFADVVPELQKNLKEVMNDVKSDRKNTTVLKKYSSLFNNLPQPLLDALTQCPLPQPQIHNVYEKIEELEKSDKYTIKKPVIPNCTKISHEI